MRLSGKDMRFVLGDLMVHADEVTLSIDDKRTFTTENGVTDGYVDGETTASGELSVDTKNFSLIIEAAGRAGAFKSLEPFDIVFNGETVTEKLNIEAFGCLLKVSDLLNSNANGGEKLMHKLPFMVTSPDFIRINGVPYLTAKEVEGLV